MNDEKIMKRLQEHLKAALDSCGKDWLVICLQGSQNYGLSDDTSDIDSKLITIPSLNDLVLNKPAISRTFIMENEEHCDIKDVREYFKIFHKSNINFVEVLFTDWYIVNEAYEDLWLDLLAHREELARINPYAAVSCMKGMAMEKRKALCHPYPSRMYWIEKYGYDPKQLSHIIRIDSFLTKYLEGAYYESCIDEHDNQYLLDVKRGRGLEANAEAAEKLADLYMEKITIKADAFRKVVPNENNKEIDDFLNDVLYRLMVRSLKSEL